jgi:hypothetical protein
VLHNSVTNVTAHTLHTRCTVCQEGVMFACCQHRPDTGKMPMLSWQSTTAIAAINTSTPIIVSSFFSWGQTAPGLAGSHWSGHPNRQQVLLLLLLHVTVPATWTPCGTTPGPYAPSPAAAAAAALLLVPLVSSHRLLLLCVNLADQGWLLLCRRLAVPAACCWFYCS